MTPVVKQLLIINILFFLGCFVVPGAKDILSLYYFENSNFRIWQPITHMFMHDGIAHIAFNMFALVSFGSILEHFWGWKKFLFFYLSCGIGAFLLHTGMNYYYFHQGLNTLVANGNSAHDVINVLNEGKYNNSWADILTQKGLDNFLMSFYTKSLGASGAIYGLLIAFAFMFPDAQLSLMFIPIPIKAKYFVPIYMFLYDGFFGIFSSSMFGFSTGVAHFAHIGGALTGLLMMLYWRNGKFNHKRWN